MALSWPDRQLFARTSSTARKEANDLEAQGFEQLYRRFGPAIHRRALSITAHPEESLATTQDTFLAFMEGRAALCREATAFTVLYQIATYKAVDRLRRRARWSGKLRLLAPHPDALEAAGLETTVTHLGGLERVEAAGDLALLTEGEDRRVLTAAFLYFVEGHSLEEVGQAIDLCRKTVSKLLGQFIRRTSKRVARLEAPMDVQARSYVPVFNAR